MTLSGLSMSTGLKLAADKSGRRPTAAWYDSWLLLASVTLSPGKLLMSADAVDEPTRPVPPITTTCLPWKSLAVGALVLHTTTAALAWGLAGRHGRGAERRSIPTVICVAAAVCGVWACRWPGQRRRLGCAQGDGGTSVIYERSPARVALQKPAPPSAPKVDELLGLTSWARWASLRPSAVLVMRAACVYYYYLQPSWADLHTATATSCHAIGRTQAHAH